MTWAFPKFDCIFLTMRKENSKFIENKYRVRLEGMQQRTEDFFPSIKGVCDDNYSWYIFRIHGLINSVSDSKEFSFSAYNIWSMIESFDNWFVMDVNIRDRCSNIIFDTSISDYESLSWYSQQFDSQIVQLLNLIFKTVVLANWMKGETIRENVNNSITRQQFRIKRIERRKNLIILIVHID